MKTWDDHHLFRVWLPSQGALGDPEYPLVTHPQQAEWVSVSSGGAPFWAEVSSTTIETAKALDPEAFDADAQAITARCMAGGWGDQQFLRAAMEHGTRRFKALLNAEKAIRHLDGRLATLASQAQVDFVRGLLDSRYVADHDYALYRETLDALEGALTKTQAQDLIPRLQRYPKINRRFERENSQDPDTDIAGNLYWGDEPPW
jgi:hypothetical protein